ncbi:pentatricopeptide repeat-containing protein At1g28690, mitochondrial [Macadamia integrifolia]|uniref:pentatricopeptide repeat-containing protein At1g28690, mitochondrial n=1 Tax=Macadamia integrifolia TaxID=60698 RepID=UPI001C52FBD9|nr:pentatricopeptide repeat-containing protein At1g28690, mitochondrial [Macadamia integrifolia]XP_042480021.1 pentatricopeptide repeat-containing protein At1g28690, mitochondrial [Macadamia integrifolia]
MKNRTLRFPTYKSFPRNYDYISPPNSNSLSAALQHYIQSDSPSHGQKIYAHILKIGFSPNTNISIKLLILNIKSGCLSYARKIFDQMSKPTVSSYNSMIAAYLKQGQAGESLNLIRKLTSSNEKPDGFTFSLILKLSTTATCNVMLSCDIGKQVHAQILKSDVQLDDVLVTALVDTYAKNGKVDYARKVFDKRLKKNVICSTAMISGYMKQGSVADAEEIFQRTIDKDIVVFNAMIEGYSKLLETAKRSFEVYIDMQRINFRPTLSTFVSVIGACSILSAFEVGQQIQTQLMKTELFTDVKLGSALIDMYSKCGRTEEAQRIFNYMPEKNVFSWTSMIDGYGKNGNPTEALELFNKMQIDYEIKPNYVTFLSALSACGHAGLVAKGQEIFNSMERDYSLNPRVEHYACMVDLLGRAGSLQQAWEFIIAMPVKPDSDVWGALLGACRLHGDVEMAAIAADELFKLRSDGRPGAYVALSNTFAAAGKWDGVTEIRELMKERGVSKDAACSWVGTESGLCGFHVSQNT